MDNIGDTLSSIPKLALDHWIFFVVSFVLGMAGQVFKGRVWTKANAEKSRVFYWIRALLPLHAPVVGTLLGIVLVIIWGKDAPVGPGITGTGQIVIYYMAAGGFSAWVVGGWQHFMKERGISDPTRLSMLPGEVDADDDGFPDDSGPPPVPVNLRSAKTPKAGGV